MSPSPSAPAAESPSSPTSLPSSPPATTGLFLPPKGPAVPLPPPPSSSTSDPGPQSSLPPFGDPEGTWSGDSADSAETSSGRDESSDTPSTGSGFSVSRATLRAAIGQGLRTVTHVISRIAASPVEQQFGVWQADPDDVKDISTPAARVIWRRLPADARSSDTVDLVVLGLALIGYVAKSMDRKGEAARAVAAGEIIDLPPGVSATFVPSGDAAADAAAAEAWGVPGYPAPAP